MTIQHKELAGGRWEKLSFPEQMANIGSEISRALNWQKKGNPEYSQKAASRALELLYLTLASLKTHSHYKELTRLKESILDYFYGHNQFSFSEASWRKYFYYFVYASRRKKIGQPGSGL